MSADNFERAVRDQVRARAAELDRTVFPVPSLQALLTPPRPFVRPNGRTSLGLGLTVAGVAVLTIAFVLGSLLLGQRPGSGPLSSVTPSVLPSFATPSASLATAARSLATAIPSPSPTSQSWSRQVTTSEVNVGFVRPEAHES